MKIGHYYEIEEGREELDDNNGQGPDDDMMTRLTEYEYIWPRRTYAERLALARKLVTAIHGTDISKLVAIPDKKETEKFFRKCIMSGDDNPNNAKWMALRFRQWLAGMTRKDIDEINKNRCNQLFPNSL